MSKPIPARKRVEVSPGEPVRIIRELQGLSQGELSALCGIPQSTISCIETGRIDLGAERAKALATPCTATPPCWCFPAGNSMARHSGNSAHAR